MGKTKPILSIKQVLDIEFLMEQSKALAHSLWIRFEGTPMLSLKDGRIKSIPNFTGTAVPKLSETMMAKMHKVGYTDNAGVLLKLGNRVLIAKATLDWFSQNHWHNRFGWHPVKPYSLKDLECGIDPTRASLKKTSLESGYWTNGRIVFRMSSGELDRLRIAWKTHVASIENFADIKFLLKTRGKTLHIAHLKAVRSNDEGFVWYLIQSNDGEEYVVVAAKYFETVVSRFPKAKLFVENGNKCVWFFAGMKCIGIVMPIMGKYIEDPIVDIHSMLED